MILVFVLFLMHGVVVVESGCEGPFHSIKCFFEYHLFQHPSFLSSSFCLSISVCLYLYLCWPFLSLRDLRQNELIQMRLSVGGCRCFPASFSCGGRKKALFRALKPCVRTSSMKVYVSVSTVCIHSVYVHLHTQIHTHNVYM